jgi:hypothetical protein
MGLNFISEFFVSLTALSTLVSIASEGVAKIVLQIWNYTIKGWQASVLALLSSFAVIGVGSALNFGMFGIEDFSPVNDLLTTLIMGVGIWISAKGIFSLAVLQQVLTFFKFKVPTVPQPPDNG